MAHLYMNFVDDIDNYLHTCVYRCVVFDVFVQISGVCVFMCVLRVQMCDE